MIETEMVEVLHVILEMICVLISRTCFQILLNMFFRKFSYQKLNLLLSEYFTALLILNENQSYKLKSPSSALVSNYKEFCQKVSLTEIIKEPTRITCSTSTLLHHTNSSQKFSQKGMIDVRISDHQLIYCTRKIKRTKHNMHNQIQVRSLKKYSAEIFTNALKTVPFSYCNIFSNVNVA